MEEESPVSARGETIGETMAAITLFIKSTHLKVLQSGPGHLEMLLPCVPSICPRLGSFCTSFLEVVQVLDLIFAKMAALVSAVIAKKSIWQLDFYLTFPQNRDGSRLPGRKQENNSFRWEDN